MLYSHQFEEITPWLKYTQDGSTEGMSSRQTLAHNLRLLRAAKGLSQEALADGAMVDRTYISALERQKYSVSIDRLDEIAKTLGVETYVLLMKDLPPEALKA
ncbi:helix-turn-helix domain-containing protein [Sphingobium sp. MI1205]|uniref:helix-turn-helix domain-containing protein n=1 Tax=Sphingobium sp. MI1205 TaxID=407020 RepID=UPI000AC1E6CA|nr:helix-turn-helix transcriptional regulator [Sphingobium sp. MI1205]